MHTTLVSRKRGMIYLVIHTVRKKSLVGYNVKVWQLNATLVLRAICDVSNWHNSGRPNKSCTFYHPHGLSETQRLHRFISYCLLKLLINIFHMKSLIYLTSVIVTLRDFKTVNISCEKWNIQQSWPCSAVAVKTLGQCNTAGLKRSGLIAAHGWEHFQHRYVSSYIDLDFLFPYNSDDNFRREKHW